MTRKLRMTWLTATSPKDFEEAKMAIMFEDMTIEKKNNHGTLVLDPLAMLFNNLSVSQRSEMRPSSVELRAYHAWFRFQRAHNMPGATSTITRKLRIATSVRRG